MKRWILRRLTSVPGLCGLLTLVIVAIYVPVGLLTGTPIDEMLLGMAIGYVCSVIVLSVLHRWAHGTWGWA